MNNSFTRLAQDISLEHRKQDTANEHQHRRDDQHDADGAECAFLALPLVPRRAFVVIVRPPRVRRQRRVTEKQGRPDYVVFQTILNAVRSRY